MSTENSLDVVKGFLAAMGGDRDGILALITDDVEWIIPGDGWPLAGHHRGRDGVANVLRKASEEVETSFSKPPEFVAQGDRVLVIGVATGKIKATGKAFTDDWVFDLTIRDGKVARLKEYVDTQALARASSSEPESTGNSPADRSDLRAS